MSDENKVNLIPLLIKLFAVCVSAIVIFMLFNYMNTDPDKREADPQEEAVYREKKLEGLQSPIHIAASKGDLKAVNAILDSLQSQTRSAGPSRRGYFAN